MKAIGKWAEAHTAWLLKHLIFDIAGSVIMIDSAGYQREIAQQIVQGKGDYILALKGIQRSLYKAVRDFLVASMQINFKAPARTALPRLSKGMAEWIA